MKFSLSQFRTASSTTSLRKHFLSKLKTLNPDEFNNLVIAQFSQHKCSNLMEKVVCRPDVLLTAYRRLAENSRSKVDDVSHRASKDGIDRFWLEKASEELRNGRFDVKNNCVLISHWKGDAEPLYLPNLKLRVVMEAVKMALDAVYEPRFVTFVYGGRVGMGRHTALRYIKNSVVNPTWWFRIVFEKTCFDSERVQKLISLMQRKVNDPVLFELICRFFEAQVLRMSLGDFSLGRGFPQESSLCPLLLNIYFDGFDHELKYLRRDIERSSSEGLVRAFSSIRHQVFDDLQTTENLLPVLPNSSEQSMKDCSGTLHGPIYNPVKLYACRYLDEMLLITSGSKELMLDIRERLIRVLEDELKLKVEHSKALLHSAVQERIEFLGMHLQAVPPSKLGPDLSEKAKRAINKHKRQRQVRAIELRNARDTRLKKEGMEILRHVLQKFRRSGYGKRDLGIAPQIRMIFKDWAQEVVSDFLKERSEHRWFFHRQLSESVFLSSPSVRQHLPPYLLEAYQDFQQKVVKYLETDIINLPGQIAEAETEQKKFEAETMRDLTKLSIKVSVPFEFVKRLLRFAGFTDSNGRPQPIKILFPLDDEEIIRWYSGIGMRFLNYFCCCHDFKMVKTCVNYHLRFSCILTLAEKHGCTKKQAIRHYTKDLMATGSDEAIFPSETKIKMMGNQYAADPKPIDDLLSMTLIRSPFAGPFPSCSALGCDRTATAVYLISLLRCRVLANKTAKRKRVYGIGAIDEAFNRKYIPFCEEHARHVSSGEITLQDIDYRLLYDSRSALKSDLGSYNFCSNSS